MVEFYTKIRLKGVVNMRKPILDPSVIVRRALKIDLSEHHKCAFVERSSNCLAAPSGQAPCRIAARRRRGA